MMKWQDEIKERYFHLSNSELFDSVLSLARGDDWDGSFTKRGEWEFEYARNLLRARLSFWLYESNSL